MREHEPAVEAAHDVELDHVGAVRGSGLDRRQAVLGRERCRAPMADQDHVPVAPEQLHQGTRRMTTTARSSESSPPE